MSVDNDVISELPVKRFRRQRFMSCPSIDEHVSSRMAIIAAVPRQHRQSHIDQFSCAHSVYPGGDGASEAASDTVEGRTSSIGVRAFDTWRPRRNSSSRGDAQSLAYRATFTLNEERVLDAMNVDTNRLKQTTIASSAASRGPSSGSSRASSGSGLAAIATAASGTGPGPLWYRCDKGHQMAANNPFKSDLFLRVLYLIGSAASDTDRGSRHSSGGSDNANAIQQQFLSDEQIRENQLREQLDGVERLRHEMAGGDGSSGRSGNVTPAEFIYQTIPNIIKRNSFVNLKVEPEPAPLYKQSADDLVDHHTEIITLKSNKSSHKLTGMEKCMLAPLTF